MGKRELLHRIIRAYSKKEPIAIISRIGYSCDDNKFIIRSDGRVIEGTEVGFRLEEPVIDRVSKLMATGESCALIETEVENKLATIVVDIVRPPRCLIVFGAGHVGNAVATIGAFVGFEVTIIDDREAFLRSDRFKDQKIRPLLLSFSGPMNEVDLPEGSAVVIVTRGHQYDEICLRDVLGYNLKYLGMIGSRRRVISIMEKLVREGIPEEKLAKVHAPIGLRIGAKSPQEIAVAIVAEVIQSFNT